jgi:translation initiation factor 3 subunit D
VNQAFYFTHENDDDFQLVDMSKTQRKYAGGNRRFHQIRQQQQMRRRRNEERQQTQDKQQQRRVGKQKLQQRQRYAIYRRWGHQNENKPVRDASVNVRRDWKHIQDFEFSDLQKAGLLVTAPEDLKLCGSLLYYDESFDRVGIRNEKPLEKHDRSFFNVTTSDDPVIQELSAADDNHIFATDTILAVLMCATRSVYSWDILVRKVGNKLFFDKRDHSGIDYLTVNETASEPPSDEKDDKSINSAGSLSREATYINQNFSQQILSGSADPLQLANSNPFVQGDDENPASIAYRYRRFKVGEYNLVVRAELDGVLADKDAPSGKNSYITIKALNEFDPKKDIDWRQKLDTQRGAVLATELKNNSNKLARWTIQSLLAGTTVMKLGFVSRVNPKTPLPHVIVGCQSYKPREFAKQVGVDIKNAWGVFKRVVDQCMAAPDGKYVLLKDPNKSTLHLYSVPENVFDNMYDEEDDDEEDLLIVKGSGQASSLSNPLSSGLGISPILPSTSVPIVGKLDVEKEDGKGKEKE